MCPTTSYVALVLQDAVRPKNYRSTVRPGRSRGAGRLRHALAASVLHNYNVE